jgi:hypothetical protein
MIQLYIFDVSILITNEYMENSLVVARKSYEKKIGGSFKPNTNTCEKTGINRKRMGMLLKGRNKSPLTVQEAVSLANLFEVDIKSLI